MNWGRLAIVVIGSVVAASFTDWLFMGVLFHGRYLSTPELWRTGQSEGMKIGVSQLIGLLMSAAFAGLLVRFGATRIGSGLTAAGLVWLAGPVTLIAQYVLWTKLDPWVGAAHAGGWLARLLITAALAAWLL